MSDTITESVGRKIISLLEDVVSALGDVVSELQYVKSEVQRLDGIDDQPDEVNSSLGGIAADVSRIEGKISELRCFCPLAFENLAGLRFLLPLTCVGFLGSGTIEAAYARNIDFHLLGGRFSSVSG